MNESCKLWMEIAAGIQLVSAQSQENIYSENSQTKVK